MAHILLLDNFDSFTYNLADYLEQCGAECYVVRNDVGLDEIRRYEYDGVVLSPGPGEPGVAGCMPQVIEYYHQRLPMLGICLGHQALGAFFGATLTKAIRPMHGKISRIVCEEDELFEGLPRELQVVRYHSLVLRELSSDLLSLAQTDEGEVMALRHRVLPIHGVQFHPEAALTQGGLPLLKNWLRFVHVSVNIP